MQSTFQNKLLTPITYQLSELSQTALQDYVSFKPKLSPTQKQSIRQKDEDKYPQKNSLKRY